MFQLVTMVTPGMCWLYLILWTRRLYYRTMIIRWYVIGWWIISSHYNARLCMLSQFFLFTSCIICTKFRMLTRWWEKLALSIFLIIYVNILYVLYKKWLVFQWFCPDLLGIYNFVLKPSKNIYKMFIKHKKRRGELWISIIII